MKTSLVAASICSMFFVLLFEHLLVHTADGHKVVNSSEHINLSSAWKTSLANQWQSFSSWSRNTPQDNKYEAATEILDKKLDGTTREMMLMYGGESSHSDYRTWLYDIHTNSWETPGEQSGPKGIIHHTLVSLCRTSVLLFGGVSSLLASQNGKCNNETWIFRMKEKTWRRLDTIIHSHNKSDYVTPRCRHVATVVHLPNSLCICKESMIIYSGFYDNGEEWRSSTNKGLNDLWLLKCNDDVSLVYEWILLDKNPPKLISPAIISVFGNTVVYAYGDYVANPLVRSQAREVWSYRVSTGTWKRHSNHSEQLRYPPLAIYISNSNKSCHSLLLCCRYNSFDPFIDFDLVSEEWFQLETKYFVLLTAHRKLLMTKVGNHGIIFDRHWTLPGSLNQMWLVMLSDECKWIFETIPYPQLSPLKQTFISTGGFMQKEEEVLLYGGVTFDTTTRVDELVHCLYRLDLKTLEWTTEMLGSSGTTELYFKAFSTATVLLDFVLVVYGGWKQIFALEASPDHDLEPIHFMDHDIEPLNNVWGYYNQLTARLWIKYLTKGRKPSGRIFHASTANSVQTMVIYGGIAFHGLATNNITIEFLHDLWSFTLPLLNENSIDLAEQQNGSQWRLIDFLGPNTSYAMSLVNIDNILYMYGGSDTVFTLDDVYYSNIEETFNLVFRCLNTLWTYNYLNHIGWVQIRYKGKSPGNRCFHQSHAFGNKMLLTGGCINEFEITINRHTFFVKINCEDDRETAGVWIYDPITISWLQLTAQPLYYKYPFGPFRVVWNDFLLSFGGLLVNPYEIGQFHGDWNNFFYFKPSCPAGMASKNLQHEMCYNCPVGHFSATPHSPCSPCPDGLTTEHEGSGSPANCSRCVDNYCGYGTCYVTLPGPSSTCECQFGFTKNNKGLCTVATFYIAASGFTSGVALLLLIVVLVTKFRKARKDDKVIIKNKDHELMELTNVFNIDSKELKLRKRIDKDCPGGYGEVYLAEYREMMVAVKKLQGIHMELDRIELEFEREIEVMRAIRHPNIVLFLGGGRYHDDGCPFLVVEYMARGSLTSILKNRKIDLEDNLKLRFTIDVAKGMRFLHSQRPPRVHRDLKSSNLLVSQQWVVKVADFGSARLVKDEGISQEAVRGAGPLDLTAPLLGADYQLSSGVGTPSWCAPEILSGQGYGTAADVYR